MNNLLKIMMILILGFMILKNSKKNKESFTAVDPSKMDQYDKLIWCKDNLKNKKSNQ